MFARPALFLAATLVGVAFLAVLIFGGLMLLMGTAGYVIAKTASALADRTGIADSLVGALATAVVTSMPELIQSPSSLQSEQIHRALEQALERAIEHLDDTIAAGAGLVK